MRGWILFVSAVGLLAFDRTTMIEQINSIERIYQDRLHCLERKTAKECIRSHPQDPQSDALATTFSMAFPKSYYKAKLKRDLAILREKKLCIGRAMSDFEAKECLKNR